MVNLCSPAESTRQGTFCLWHQCPSLGQLRSCAESSVVYLTSCPWFLHPSSVREACVWSLILANFGCSLVDACVVSAFIVIPHFPQITLVFVELSSYRTPVTLDQRPMLMQFISTIDTRGGWPCIQSWLYSLGCWLGLWNRDDAVRVTLPASCDYILFLDLLQDTSFGFWRPFLTGRIEQKALHFTSLSWSIFAISSISPVPQCFRTQHSILTLCTERDHFSLALWEPLIPRIVSEALFLDLAFMGLYEVIWLCLTFRMCLQLLPSLLWCIWL